MGTIIHENDDNFYDLRALKYNKSSTSFVVHGILEEWHSPTRQIISILHIPKFSNAKSYLIPNPTINLLALNRNSICVAQLDSCEKAFTTSCVKVGWCLYVVKVHKPKKVVHLDIMQIIDQIS